MTPERLSRLFLVAPATIAIALTLAFAATASAAVVESCTGGSGLVGGALIAEDGDQCGDGVGTNELDWESIAGQFGTYAPNPDSPPAAPATQGIAVPDDVVNPDSTAFVSSAKEDDTSGWQVGFSNVNDKVNLYGSWAFSETIGTDLFLYLAFQREAPNNPANASANVDFELNQAPAGEATSYVENPHGVKVIKRQGNGVDDAVPDDLLFVYDWKGNDDIALKICRWGEGADDPATPDLDEGWLKGTWSCEALATAEAEGEVNDAGDITSLLPGAVDPGGVILRREFGEAAFNLTAALGLAGDECVSYGAFHTRTRESGSLSANMTDLILPAPVQVSNCGTLVVEKQTSEPDTTEFPFTTTGIPVPPAQASQQDVDAFDLADDDQQTITNVEPNDGGAGTYDVTEGDSPSGYELDRIECRSSDDTSVLDDLTTYSGATAQVKVAAGETIHCTFFNRLKSSGIEIVKTGPAFAYHGDTVTFVYTVTNPEEQSIHDVVVTDDKCSPVTLTAKAEGPGDTGADFLDPGDTWTYACTMTMGDHADGEQDPHVNLATVNGKDERDQPVSDTDPHETDLLHPGISLVKDGPADGLAGLPVTYTLRVTNTGDTAMAQANVNFTDPRCDLVQPVRSDVNGDESPDVFQPNDSWTFTCTASTAVGDTQVVNVADVCGTDVNGRTVCARDDAVTNLRQPERQVEPQRAQPGSARLAGPTRCVRGPFNLRVSGKQVRSVTVFVGSRRVARRTGAGNVRIDPRTAGYDVQRVRVVVRFAAESATSAKTIRATFQRCPKKQFRPKFTG